MEEDANTNNFKKINENDTEDNKIEDNDQPGNCENQDDQLSKILEASDANQKE